jgi:hypothetical protein
MSSRLKLLLLSCQMPLLTPYPHGATRLREIAEAVLPAAKLKLECLQDLLS